MEKLVIDTIMEVTELPKEKISLNSNLLTDLELDSIDIVSLIAAFEEKLSIEIPDKDIKSFQTVQDIVNYLKKDE